MLDRSNFSYGHNPYKGSLNMATTVDIINTAKKNPLWVALGLLIIAIIIVLIIWLIIWLVKKNKDENAEGASYSVGDTIRNMWNKDRIQPMRSNVPIVNRSASKVTRTNTSTRATPAIKATPVTPVVKNNQDLINMMKQINNTDVEVLALSTDAGRIRDKIQKCSDYASKAIMYNELTPAEKETVTSEIAWSQENIFEVLCNLDMMSTKKIEMVNACESNSNECKSFSTSEYMNLLRQSQQKLQSIDDKLESCMNMLKTKVKAMKMSQVMKNDIDKKSKSSIDIVKNNPKLKQYFSNPNRSYSVAKSITNLTDENMKKFCDLVKA